VTDYVNIFILMSKQGFIQTPFIKLHQ